MSIGDERYVLFTTFRRSGTPVSSPVWIVPDEAGRVGFYTTDGSGKTKRLRNNPDVTLQPCDVRGRVRSGTLPVSATAEMVTSGPAFVRVKAALRRKYGVQVRMATLFGGLAMRRKGLTYADTVVLVTPDPVVAGADGG